MGSEDGRWIELNRSGLMKDFHITGAESSNALVIIIIIIITIIIIIIPFMQGIYTHIPETNGVPRDYSYYYYYTICMSPVTGISSWYFS